MASMDTLRRMQGVSGHRLQSAVKSAAGTTTRLQRCACVRPVAVWTRPTPDKDDDFIKPAYVPARPSSDPVIQPYRRDDQPLYQPVPEFRPAELPDKTKEMPDAPKMPERRPDPIPAGNPKEKPAERTEEQREAPPPKTNDS